jgi:hypothetical protein
MNHKKVGDIIEVLNNSFRICGIVPHGKGGRKFLSLSTMQDLIGADGRTSVFYLKLDNAANVGTVEANNKGHTRHGTIFGAVHAGVSLDDDTGQPARL